MNASDLIIYCYQHGQIDARHFAKTHNLDLDELLATLRALINPNIPTTIVLEENRSTFQLSVGSLYELEDEYHGKPFTDGSALEINVLQALQNNDGVLDENELKESIEQPIDRAITRLLRKSQIEVVKQNPRNAYLTDCRKFEITYDGEVRLGV